MSIIRSVIVVAALATLGANGAGLTQSPPAQAQAGALPAVKGVDGQWEGKLTAGGASLTVVFRFRTDAAGTHAVIDSPDQGASDIPITALARDGDQVTLEASSIDGGYKGKLDAGGKSMTGTWTQAGNSLPLVLTRKP